eukprot:1555544-Rhodomonas_salina.6
MVRGRDYGHGPVALRCATDCKIGCRLLAAAVRCSRGMITAFLGPGPSLSPGSGNRDLSRG